MYEYECQNCRERFEQIQSLQDLKKKVFCPKCGSEDIQKLFSSFGIGDFSDLGGCGTGSFG